MLRIHSIHSNGIWIRCSLHILSLYEGLPACNPTSKSNLAIATSKCSTASNRGQFLHDSSQFLGQVVYTGCPSEWFILMAQILSWIWWVHIFCWQAPACTTIWEYSGSNQEPTLQQRRYSVDPWTWSPMIESRTPPSRSCWLDRNWNGLLKAQLMTSPEATFCETVENVAEWQLSYTVSRRTVSHFTEQLIGIYGKVYDPAIPLMCVCPRKILD